MPKISSKSEIIQAISPLLPAGCRLMASETFHWSPKTKTIHIVERRLNDHPGQAALIHELSHATLGHQSYQLDSELVALETEAWDQAKLISSELGLDIDKTYIEDCLDTYREWLYTRSTCPECKTNGLQVDRSTYDCVNCSTSWRVSPSRFCRAYRMRSRHSKTPSSVTRTVFA